MSQQNLYVGQNLFTGKDVGEDLPQVGSRYNYSNSFSFQDSSFGTFAKSTSRIGIMIEVRLTKRHANERSKAKAVHS